MPAPGVEFRALGGAEAGELVGEISELYAAVYAEPPYGWEAEHLALFQERLDAQRRQPGFALVTARAGAELVGAGLGVTLRPATPWWQNLLTPLPAALTQERPGRTFALVELMVRPAWRRQRLATAIHDLLLRERAEERATLTVLPAATAAQAAYHAWGWRPVGQKRNPLPGSPVFDVMLKELRRPDKEPTYKER